MRHKIANLPDNNATRHENERFAARVPAWAPYVTSITLLGGGSRVHVEYKGGEFELPISELQSLMIYGDSQPIGMEVFEALSRRGIPIVFHRRNLATSLWIHGGVRGQKHDVLTRQMLARDNEHKRRYIARALLREKFQAMRWLVPNPPKLPKRATIDELRIIESHHAKRYWAIYYALLGKRHEGRRVTGETKSILDAVAKFLSGAMLRWVTYHHLSPFHGFLHEPTDYPALVYDLLEPYRAEYELVVLEILRTNEELKQKERLGMAIEAVKEAMQTKVYTHQTRQIVLRQELMHGAALALRSYLLGESSRFVLPTSGERIGGRPLKLGYRLPGRDAGPSRIRHAIETAVGQEQERLASLTVVAQTAVNE